MNFEIQIDKANNIFIKLKEILKDKPGYDDLIKLEECLNNEILNHYEKQLKKQEKRIAMQLAIDTRKSGLSISELSENTAKIQKLLEEN